MPLPLSTQKVQNGNSKRETRQSVRSIARGQNNTINNSPEKLLDELAKKTFDKKRQKRTISKSASRSKQSSKQRKRKCSTENIEEPKTKVARKSPTSKKKQTKKRADLKLQAKLSQGRKRKRTIMEERRGKIPRLSSKQKSVGVKEMKHDKLKSKNIISSADKKNKEGRKRSNKTDVKMSTKTATTKNKSRRIPERSVLSTGRMKPEINKNRNRNADGKQIRSAEKGNVENINEPQINRQKPHLKKIKRITTKLNLLVSTICCVDEKTMWIGRQAYGSLMKVQFGQSSNLTIIKEFKYPEFDFYDFCFDRENNRVLFCDRRNNCVMSISSSYQVGIFQSVKPFNPTCITISPDNSIFIGLVQAYAYTEGSRPNEIIKVDVNGTVCFRIRSTEEGVRNFLFPHRCSINPVNSDIVIADQRQNKGFIVNFNSEGKRTFEYTENTVEKFFVPRGLTCSSKGNILCCNEYNGDIHILDTGGRLVQLIETRSLRILGKPWSLSWNMSGNLMIGIMKTGTGMIYIAEYNDGKQEQER